MKEIFKRTIASIICLSIVAFLIGLIMVVAPDLSLATIGIIVGTYILIHGIVILALDSNSYTYYVPFDGTMSGVLFILLGILLIFVPNLLSIALTIALGVWIVLSSVNVIKIAVTFRKELSNWIVVLLFGILDLIVGIIILFNPFTSSLSVTVIAGIVIMVHSVINIIDMIVIKKNVKSIVESIENTVKRI